MFRIIVIAVIAILGWNWITSPDKPRTQAVAPASAPASPVAKPTEQEAPFLDSLKRTAGNVVEAGKATAVVARKAVDATGKAAEGVKETARKMEPYVDRAGEVVKDWKAAGPARIDEVAQSYGGGARSQPVPARQPGARGWPEREIRCGEQDSLGNIKYCFRDER